MMENLVIMKPYSFVMENDDGEHVSELYVVDDDTVIIGGDLMQGLERNSTISLTDCLMKSRLSQTFTDKIC